MNKPFRWLLQRYERALDWTMVRPQRVATSRRNVPAPRVEAAPEPFVPHLPEVLDEAPDEMVVDEPAVRPSRRAEDVYVADEALPGPEGAAETTGTGVAAIASGSAIAYFDTIQPAEDASRA